MVMAGIIVCAITYASEGNVTVERNISENHSGCVSEFTFGALEVFLIIVAFLWVLCLSNGFLNHPFTSD